MNIEKLYWLWNENLNETEFKLGGEIQKLLDRQLVIQTAEGYSGVEGLPWTIEVENGLIHAVFYRQSFPLFQGFQEDDWNLKLDEFRLKMNTLLAPVNKEFLGEKLYVVFRDQFVAIAGILASKHNIV